MAIINIQDQDLRSVAIKDGTALKIVSTLKFPDATTQITAAGSSQWVASGANIYNANSGDVGVGVATPLTRLHVVGADGATSQIAQQVVAGSLNFCVRVVNPAGAIHYIIGNSNTGFLWSTGATNIDGAGITTRMSLLVSGNLKLAGAATRATTEGTNHLDIFDGTAPIGTLANGISLYSSAGEAYFMDAAGNGSLQSPHDKKTGKWIFYSKHTPSGRVLRVEMEDLIKALNKKFGWDFVKEWKEAA